VTFVLIILLTAEFPIGTKEFMERKKLYQSQYSRLIGLTFEVKRNIKQGFYPLFFLRNGERL
jgi:hypothetical protein